MAVTSTIEYCTNRDLQDIYPHISEYDLKRRLYNFQADSANAYDSTLDLYYLNGSGLVTELFFNGAKMNKITYSTTNVSALDGSITAAQTEAIDHTVVGGTTPLATTDIIKIDDEYMRIITITDSDTFVLSDRGFFGSSPVFHYDDAKIYSIIDASLEVQDAASNSDAPSFLYDSDLDTLILISDVDINQHIIEAGDDWSTIRQRFRRKASRLMESRLDNRLSREVLKDREGNYREIIVHATALQTVILLLKAHDPTNEVITPFQDELDEILDGLKAGSIVLPTGISSDSSRGVIREVSVNSSSDLRPVELKGNYNLYGYDNIKVVVDSGGIIGTSTYSVYIKDNEKLKTDQVVTSEKITGDYDMIISGLYMRWSGDDVITAITTTNDEYEIEVHSASINTSVSSVGSIRMTRR